MAPYDRLAVARSPRNATGAGIGPSRSVRPFSWLLAAWMAPFGCADGLDDGLWGSDAMKELVGAPVGVL